MGWHAKKTKFQRLKSRGGLYKYNQIKIINGETMGHGFSLNKRYRISYVAESLTGEYACYITGKGRCT